MRGSGQIAALEGVAGHGIAGREIHFPVERVDRLQRNEQRDRPYSVADLGFHFGHTGRADLGADVAVRADTEQIAAARVHFKIDVAIALVGREIEKELQTTVLTLGLSIALFLVL